MAAVLTCIRRWFLCHSVILSYHKKSGPIGLDSQDCSACRSEEVGERWSKKKKKNTVREREGEKAAVRFCQHEEFIPLEERKEASGPRGPTAKAAVEFVVCRKTVAGSSLFLTQHKTSCIRATQAA